MAYETITYTNEDGKLITCKKEDAPEWVQHNWPEPLTFRKEGNTIYVSHSKKEEPKPACDHIVGLRNIYHITKGLQPGFIEVHASDSLGKKIDYYKFKECPECGEKLNLKKDE